MTTTPQFTSPVKRSGVHTRFQRINADYYNLTDSDGWPIAALLVLSDRKRAPVRAELHLYPDTEGQTEETALRQAVHLLEERYHRRPGSEMGEILPLRVMRTHQERDSQRVRLLPSLAPRLELPHYWKPAAVGAGALILLLLLVWISSALWGREEPPATTASGPAALPAAPNPTAAPSIQPATAAEAETQSAANLYPMRTNGLPVSRNALELALSQRVRIRAGLTLTLRTEAGAEAGQATGFMQNQQEATLIGGPVWMPGDTDTIVWWYVRLGDGQEAWAPANTSRLTLLEPVP